MNIDVCKIVLQHILYFFKCNYIKCGKSFLQNEFMCDIAEVI